MDLNEVSRLLRAFGPVYAAQALGYFEDEGLDLKSCLDRGRTPLDTYSVAMRGPDVEIDTVQGSVPVGMLGATLMHEHVFVLDKNIESNLLTEWDEDQQVVRAAQLLEDAYEAGARTLVDLTDADQGRDVLRLRRVAEATRVSIVVATGLYSFNDLPIYFRNRGPGRAFGGDEPLVSFFIHDLTEGVANTGIRAAIIKCATDHSGLNAAAARVFRAAAAAHRETGAPITTHTDASTRGGLEQLELFAREGVDLDKVVIGHSGDSTDLQYLRQILDTGASVGMDRFGLSSILDLDSGVDTIVRLCAEGYSSQIVVSHDYACFSQSVDQAMLRTMEPAWDYTCFHALAVPALVERGIAPGVVDEFLVANPARILGR